MDNIKKIIKEEETENYKILYVEIKPWSCEFMGREITIDHGVKFIEKLKIDLVQE